MVGVLLERDAAHRVEGLAWQPPREIAMAAEQQDIRQPAGWLSTPALVIIFCAALGPLLVVLLYSFMIKGDYGEVKWTFSTDGWFSVFFAARHLR